MARRESMIEQPQTFRPSKNEPKHLEYVFTEENTYEAIKDGDRSLKPEKQILNLRYEL